jgi:hypothetical protein
MKNKRKKTGVSANFVNDFITRTHASYCQPNASYAPEEGPTQCDLGILALAFE